MSHFKSREFSPAGGRRGRLRFKAQGRLKVPLLTGDAESCVEAADSLWRKGCKLTAGKGMGNPVPQSQGTEFCQWQGRAGKQRCPQDLPQNLYIRSYYGEHLNVSLVIIWAKETVPQCEIAGLQKCEPINTHCFKLLNLWSFVMQKQKTINRLLEVGLFLLF